LPDTDGQQREREGSERRSGRGPISRNRIESLSDLVFGLTLSIGALTLITTPPTSPDEMNARIIAFFFNFVILIAIWVQYTTIMFRLPLEKGRVVLANIVLLLLIILSTYLITGIQWVSPPIPIPANTALDAYSSQLYSLDLAAVSGILAFFSYQLGIEEKHLLPREYLAKARLARNVQVVFVVVLLVAALPQFWEWGIAQIPLRFDAWWILLLGIIFLDAKMFSDPGDKASAVATRSQ
jgi:uncharacterized membrane protein